ncbi:expressed unknown protein [Seminavis robusta]|uniref:Uncharacterized protein n=1 Tax=Seminavis robusta TaxID=568900 RepID=A0A9N8D7G4_9STRA|nr:expressed unknown protein [Seminavis robusta]|eukprot:Sro25_g016950.1 n/a (976) ;mRNA; r:76680-79690
MKISITSVLAVLSLLAIASAKGAAVEADKDFPITNAVLTVSIISPYGTPSTPDEIKFMEAALVSSYKKSHDKTDIFVLKGAKYAGESHEPYMTSAADEDASLGLQGSSYVDIYQYFPQLFCPRRSPCRVASFEELAIATEVTDGATAGVGHPSTHHEVWEKKLCKIMSKSNYDVFKGATDCKITFEEAPDDSTAAAITTAKDAATLEVTADTAMEDVALDASDDNDFPITNAVLTISIISPYGTPSTPDEIKFMEAALVSSYKKSHDKTDIFVLKGAKYAGESHEPYMTSAADEDASLGLQGSSYVDIYQYFPQLFCPRRSPCRVASFEELAIATEVTDGATAGVGHQFTHHEVWEKKLCKIMSKSNYDVFKGATDCKITFEEAPDESAAAITTAKDAATLEVTADTAMEDVALDASDDNDFPITNAVLTVSIISPYGTVSTPDEIKFMEAALVSSYKKSHDKTDIFVLKGAKYAGESHEPYMTSGAEEDASLGLQGSSYVDIYQYFPQLFCPRRSPCRVASFEELAIATEVTDGATAGVGHPSTHHEVWEKKLCKIMSKSNYDVFKGASDCKITFEEAPDDSTAAVITTAKDAATLEVTADTAMEDVALDASDDNDFPITNAVLTVSIISPYGTVSTPDEIKFMEAALVSSYKKSHDKTDIFVLKGAKYAGESHGPSMTSAAEEDASLGLQGSSYVDIYQYFPQLFCPRRSPCRVASFEELAIATEVTDGATAGVGHPSTHHEVWEKKLCKIMSKSNYDDAATLEVTADTAMEDVALDASDDNDFPITNAVLTVSIISPYGTVSTPDEIKFMEAALVSSYKKSHDKTDIFVLKGAKYAGESHEPYMTSAADEDASLGLQGSSYVDIYQYFPQLFCPRRSPCRVASFEELSIATEVTDGATAGVGHPFTHHEVWEKKLCKIMSKSNYNVFKGATDCKITFEEAPDDSTAAVITSASDQKFNLRGAVSVSASAEEE